MNIRVSFTVVLNRQDPRIHTQINTLFGIIRIEKELNLTQLIQKKMAQGEAVNFKDFQLNSDITEMKSGFKAVKEPLFHFLQSVKIKKLDWCTEIGTGHAAHTGKVVGLLFAVKGIIETWIHCYLRIKGEPHLKVIPYYQQVRAQSTLRCMVTFRSGKAISTAYQMLRQWEKQKGRRIDEDGASNQRFDDDSNGELEGNDRCEYDRRRSS